MIRTLIQYYTTLPHLYTGYFINGWFVFCTCRPGHVGAQEVTESLLELRGMLHSQVASSEETMQNLVSSSSQLVKTKTGMQEIGADVKVSSGLISKFGRRELTDRVLIFAGLTLFFGVVLYIIQKRLLGWLW